MIWLFTPLYGNGYQFWSGIGSDIGELTLVTAAVTWYIHNQCHVEGCRKIGKHPFKQYKLCSKHHPSTPEKVTYQHVVKLHKESK